MYMTVIDWIGFAMIVLLLTCISFLFGISTGEGVANRCWEKRGIAEGVASYAEDRDGCIKFEFGPQGFEVVE